MEGEVVIYVLVDVNDEGEIVGLPKGGGSSAAPRIKAYDSLASAKRGQWHHAGRIAKVLGLELID